MLMGGVCGGESGRRCSRGDGVDACTRDSMGDAIAKNIADAGQKRRGTYGIALLDTGAFSYMLLAAAAAAADDDDDDDGGGGAGGGMQRRHRGIFKKHKDFKKPNTHTHYQYN